MAVLFYRSNIKEGENFKERMDEQIQATWEGLQDVQTFLEEDLAYAPQTFLGFVLTPDTITQAITLAATFGFGLIQEGLKKEEK